MKKGTLLLIIISGFIACGGEKEKTELDDKAVLTSKLTEISGLVADEDDLWAITDKPKAIFYKITAKGDVKQEITVNGIRAVDVEAVTKDENFVYLGDVGDNDGSREERQIIKVPKNKIGNNKEAFVDGELITFNFAGAQTVDKKKKNNFDCEPLLSFGDSLYLFTKRREDLQTELFSLPKNPGNHTAKSIAIFDSKGLVTDAAINAANDEVALIGYKKSHKYPFVLIFNNFKGNNFFSGKSERIELADKPWDWQLESITFNKDNEVFFACEETKEVKATLYAIARNKLERLNKKN